jgi:Pvc16 N-terminal domain
MSTALGISAVTAVLETLLNSVYTGSGLGTITVSAVAPDIVQSVVGTTADAHLQVNLFLHQVTLNAAWRNIGYPSLGADGRTPLKNRPLALDLHYLLTAYASQNCLAEALLGYAVQFLFETPVLLRSQIETTMQGLAANSGIPAALKTAGLDKSGLANQIEMIKLTPATLGREEMAWLWTALKADYRPTFPFQASVVLIQDQKPLLSSLPVLQREVTAQPNVFAPLPTLSEIDPPNAQPAALLGDLVTAQGSNLSGVSAVRLENSRFGVEQTITALTNAGSSSFQFKVNIAAPELPPGVYTLSAQVTTPPDTIDTNSLPLAIAPQITVSPPTVTPDVHGNANVSITCSPFVWPGQEVFLLIGNQAAPADSFTTATGTPSFTFSALTSTPNPVPLRLRVDGIDSPIIDYTKLPPVFTGPSIKVN